MRIEMWPIERPKPYEKNARKWKKAAIEKVAASIREFGWRQPIVCDAQDVIVIGHLRLAAAKHLKLTEVPVHAASDLTSEQIKLLRIADNRVHEEADWDSSLLAGEMLDLSSLGLDLSFTGFDDAEVERFLAPSTDADGKANECPELPEAPVSTLGDLWLLGKHRVLCGDSTAESAVSRLLSPTSGIPQPLLMVTDPPYGVEYNPKWREEYDQFKRHAVGKVSNDDRVDWSLAYGLFPGAVAYVWHAGVFCADVAANLASQDFEIRGQIIWKKQHFVFGRGAYHWQHEPCWYAVRKGKAANWRGDRKQSTIWEVQNLNPMGGNTEEAATGHGTQKPIELMRRPILNHTKRGEAVYDPFLGSGTTLIAAEATNRICYGLEIDPKYVDVIVQRWQQFTGKEAVLGDGDHKGATFEHVKRGRRQAAEDAIKEEVLERIGA